MTAVTGAPPAVAEVHGRLLADVERLRALAGRAATDVLVWLANTTFQLAPVETTRAFGLQSPVRQMYYLTGLALTTPEPPEHGWTDEDLAEAHVLLGRIYDAYLEMQLACIEAAESGTDVERRWRVAVPSFVSYFYAGVIASTDQLLARVEDTLVPFDDVLERVAGLSATDALRATIWIGERLQRQLDAYTTVIRVSLAVAREGHARGWSPGRIQRELRRDPRIRTIDADPSTAPVRGGASPYHVPWRDARAELGANRADAYARLFAVARGEHRAFTYPTERNPAERAPLVWVEGGQAVACASGHMLATAVLDALGDLLVSAGPDVAARFYRVRDRALERRTSDALRTLTPAAAQAVVYENLAETPTGQHEHDAVLVAGRGVLVVEAKAGRLREPLRDPLRAYPRLRDDFRAAGGIQKAFEQGERIRRAVDVDRRDVALYDSGGAERVRVMPGAVDRVRCMCVTGDEYGALAADLTLLLDKEADVPYPLAINVFDLEALVDAFARKGWGPSELLRYVDERGLLHGHVVSADELEIAAVFLLYGGLGPLREAMARFPGARVQMRADCAWVFDAIFRERQGGPRATLTALGPLRLTPVDPSLVLCVVPGGGAYLGSQTS